MNCGWKQKISIPEGTIKGVECDVFGDIEYTFQFQKVQLKVQRTTQQSLM